MDSLDKGSVNDIVLRRVISEDAVVRAYVYSATRGHRDTEDVATNWPYIRTGLPSSQ